MKQLLLLATGVLAGAVFLSYPVSGQQDAARPLHQDIGAEPGHLPKVHYAPTETSSTAYPIWIDASMVLNKDGSLNTTLVPKEMGEWDLMATLRLPLKDGCVHAGGTIEEIVDAPDRRSVEQATKISGLVILGRITEKAFGVESYKPGQLLRVVPEKVFKGQPRRVPAYFVFIPVGNFKIGNTPLCVTDSRYPDAPTVGEEVLLFVPEVTNGQEKQDEPFLQLLDDGGIVTIHSDLTVSLPAKFSATGAKPLTSSDLLSRVRAAAAMKSH
jgi:hypothetical protein